VALINNFPSFASRRNLDNIGSCPLTEIAWFKNEILFCKLFERKVIFIKISLFVVVVVYMESEKSNNPWLVFGDKMLIKKWIKCLKVL